MVIDLTERGSAAAAAVRAGVRQVDRELAQMISPEQLAGLRAGLEALTRIKDRMSDDH
jgi:DNA-binding MarR family transcriptional regulator